MNVRLAENKDISELTNLFFEFYWKFNMNQILTGASKELLKVDDPKAFSKDTIDSYFEDKLIMYVYELEGKVIGYICGTIKKHEHYQYQLEANIIDWFVTESYRGKGAGKALYEKFVEHSKSKGCSSLSLEAFWTNTETIKTYERLGFTKEEVVLRKII